MEERDLASIKRDLGIDRLALQIHDVSFPSDPDEDWGRGSPYSRGAERFLAFAARLGFDAIQLGPQGLTQRGNGSPYDATLFSRNPLNLPWGRLVEQGRLRRETLARLCSTRRDAAGAPIPHAEQFDRCQSAMAEVVANSDESDRRAAREFMATNEHWLIPDALYSALCHEHGPMWWGHWGRTPQGRFDQRLYAPVAGDESAAAQRVAELRRQYARHIEEYALVQWLLEREHRALRERLGRLGLTLWADLQVGLSPQDAWSRQSLFMPGYLMGAPPSRTNPAGQPWGYSVYDPRQLGDLASPGPALDFVRRRLDRVLAECDGVRIDHPHGWIDPWVYRSDDADPFHAVQTGARLFSSPEEADHAELSQFAIAREAQIDRQESRHADRRVRELDASQIARYSLLVDLIVERARAHGRSPQAIACEVLSTLPYPIQCVLERHRLGRFRVVQKAKLNDPTDVYRIENAEPLDWIMLGTHDTPTIWELADRWVRGEEAARWTDYLRQLGCVLEKTDAVSDATTSAGRLVDGIFQSMLASRARHVMVFFADLFGLRERYNEPGVISDVNWRLSLPGDFETVYENGRRAGKTLDVAACLRRAGESRSRSAVAARIPGTPPRSAERSGATSPDSVRADEALAGATLDSGGECHWRVWAPRASRVELLLLDDSGRVETRHVMRRATERTGRRDDNRDDRRDDRRGDTKGEKPAAESAWYEFSRDGVVAGQRYLFQLDGREPRPDPASRWQPDGVHGPSAVWDARAFAWTDSAWRGVAREALVMYELHVGTFTPEGTFAAVIPRLAALRDLGITAIELMPVGQFPGERGWGYDGAYWFAAQNSYGGPTELQRLVDACHAEGLAVILDVVYNHLGPEGNYLGEFGPIFTERHHTAWGPAVNFDGEGSAGVRQFVLDNVRHWIGDFHLDGLRLDAVHALVDDSPTHILAEIQQVARDEAARANRPMHVIAESHLNDVRFLDPPAEGGYGMDAQWSDDFHHCVHALLTGERVGYYVDYSDPARQLVKALTDVFVYDGCFSPRFGKSWGKPIAGHSGDRFVVSIQTHDQVGNRPYGDRLGVLLDPPRQRLAAGLLLLAPNVPLLFMGEEYGETRPFPFFCDFGNDWFRDEVRKGRRREFDAFYRDAVARRSRGGHDAPSRLPDPPDPVAAETFHSAILGWNWSTDPRQSGLRALYAALLELRRTAPALHDFQHRAARLLPVTPAPAEPDADLLLVLERGDPSRPEAMWRALFNLSSKPAAIPADFAGQRGFILHSEETRFGGAEDERAFRDIVPPHSFGLAASSDWHASRGG